jgi:hypothetical protein
MKSFLKFNEVNPRVYDQFKEIANLYISKGERRIKAEIICEVIRFQLMKEFNDDHKFIRFFAQDYAKKFENDFSQHVGIFTKRLVNFELED